MNSECWPWPGQLNHNGYGTLTISSKTMRAHRFVYAWAKGPIPEGCEVDHLCRQRNCVNPDHLEPVTKRENVLRGESFSAINARKTHCVNGHEYTPENTKIEKGRWRNCRECHRAANRDRLAKLRDAGV
jgi:hypothetical protein